MSSGEWNFIVGPGRDLFKKLSEMPVTLGDVASRIFQGLITGADSVFILENLEDGKYFSKETSCAYELEDELLHPLCKGSLNIRRYRVRELTRSILFPYDLQQGRATLIPADRFKNEFPKTWEYLLANKMKLESRERGKWVNERWYAFGRTQNLTEMEHVKIMTPSIAKSASFTLDASDSYYFVGSGGGGGGGYGITLREESPLKYEYVIGLLNSNLLDYYLHQIASEFRGGYYAYNRQYIEQLPIRPIDFENATARAQHDQMVSLVRQMLDVNEGLATAKTNLQKTHFQRRIAATDARIDRLVYELYGLTDEEIAIVEEATG